MLLKVDISVVMSVYNGASFLKEAMDSILNQTFKNFEFIIVNDCSKDRTKNILSSYSDSRIKLIENKKNIGLAASLNKAIKLANGIYIARMDDDDIAMPDRFEKQHSFLESHRNIGVLGTAAQWFGDREGFYKPTTENLELKYRTFFSCQFRHPSVFLRNKVLQKHHIKYDESFSSAQDYDLWTRLIPYTDFANLPNVLLKYRHHQKQISKQKRKQQLNNTYRILENNLKKLQVSYNSNDISLFYELSFFKFNFSNTKLLSIAEFFNKVLLANNQIGYFPKKYFASRISEYFYNILRHSKVSQKQKMDLYNKYGFQKYYKPFMYKIKLMLPS